jgi:hypothetical protein
MKNVVLRVISDEFLELHNMEIERRTWSQQTQARDLAECDIGLAPAPIKSVSPTRSSSEKMPIDDSQKRK